MKWEGYRKSKNFEDRRGMTTGRKVAVGGGFLGLLFLLIQVFMGGDPAQLTQALQDQMVTGQTAQAKELTAEEKMMGDFVSSVFAMTEDVWNGLFRQNGAVYREPKMVLFSEGVQSACGGASSSSGPFYCPADETVYMDLAFFNVLRERFGAKGGDFAIAYVIAHEVGHHVQHLQGILKEVQTIRRQLPQADGNKVHVAMELQADYYAGVWAHHVRKLLEPGDFEEALNAAAVVGNDNMQKQTQGYVVPESFTHGTSKQRMEWLTRGFQAGNIQDGDTYSALLK
jgi:predicted metalloprotease